MTFLQITNHLDTKVSKFEDKQEKLRGVASAKPGKPEKNGKWPKNGGVRIPDGSLLTGFYPIWRDFSGKKKNEVKSSGKKKNLTKISGNKAS